jgi:Ni/Co efflux regulator RcnB
MKNRITKLAILISVALAAGTTVFADKPDSPGNSGAQNTSQENSDRSPGHYGGDDSNGYFNDDRRERIRTYYSKSPQSGNCPPGLAKKNNGCQPPGQARKWHKGQPLPRDVVYYDLPAALIDELGRTPEGEKVVQVDSDLLLISIATGMVIDAFEVQQ